MVDASAAVGSGVPGGLRVRVLGELGAELDGRPLDLGGRRQRAVLALLVLARGDIVSADRLVSCLWAGSPPANAVGALHAYVSRLRRRLEPGQTARSRGNLIVRRADGYALAAGGDDVDAWRFERLVRDAGGPADPGSTDGAAAALSEALGLWQGPAFAEYADEEWAQAEVARLSELREVARERLVAARLSQGESAILVGELEAMVAAEPLREERWRLLVLALYRSRRQGDALAALRRARAILSEQLGVDPGPALRALEGEVLAQAPQLDPAPARAVAPAAPRPAPPAPDDDLVDRGREVAELRECLSDALAGRARFVLIEGPAGIGKSRLLAEARRMAAAQGALPLAARGSQMEKQFGFGVVRQLFEALVGGPEGPGDLLAGPAAPAAQVFDLAPAGSAPPGDHTFAVLHGLYWLAVNASGGRSLAITVDDLQWCDSASLRFLAYLVRRLEGLPVSVVAALRTGEEYDDEALLAELQHDPTTSLVRPGTLTAAGVARLVRRDLGGEVDEAFAAACHRSTSGNPLLLRQLLRALEAAEVRPSAAHVDAVTAIGSRAVSSMVLTRLRRLPAPAIAVARAVAVLGDGAELPTVALLAEVGEPEAATAIAALGRAEVIRDEYPLGFVHPLVRDAVYQDVVAGERQLYHERAARTLATRGAAAEQVAAHLLQIPQRGDAWVVDMLREAGQTMVRRGAPEGAATYLRRALAEPPTPEQRPRVLLDYGRVAVLGDGPAALACLREATEDPLIDPTTFVEAAVMLTHALIFAGDRDALATFVRSAYPRLAPEQLDARQALVALERGGAYMYTAEPSVWTAEPPPVTGDGLGARMLAGELAWEAVVGGRPREDTVRLARLALDGGRLVREDPGLFWVIAALVLDLADEDSGAFWDETLAVAHTRGSLFSVMAAHLWRGHHQWRRGDLPEAYESLSLATDQGARWAGGLPNFGVVYGEAFLTGVLLDRGDVAGARAFLTGRLAQPHIGEGGRVFDEAHARLLLAEGRHGEALNLLEQLAARTIGAATPLWPYFQNRSLRARALAGLGQHADALALAEQDLAEVRAWGAPSSIGFSLRLVGDLRRAQPGPDGDGVAELREAVALLATTTCRLEYARALSALAAAVPGDSAEHADLLRQALRLAEECGAAGLRATVRERLGRAGIAVPAEPDPAVTLTATERTIAAMAARGNDDRAIAQALFLTPRSVREVLSRLGDRSA